MLMIIVVVLYKPVLSLKNDIFSTFKYNWFLSAMLLILYCIKPIKYIVSQTEWALNSFLINSILSIIILSLYVCVRLVQSTFGKFKFFCVRCLLRVNRKSNQFYFQIGNFLWTWLDLNCLCFRLKRSAKPWTTSPAALLQVIIDVCVAAH